MRISDWSSDVCSSDLKLRRGEEGEIAAHRLQGRRCVDRPRAPALAPGGDGVQIDLRRRDRAFQVECPCDGRVKLAEFGKHLFRPEAELARAARMVGGACRGDHLQPFTRRAGGGQRSEEHTSELQSLMRISSAVFCLKKTTIT